MSVSIWIFLLVLVSTATDSLLTMTRRCRKGFCIFLPEEAIQADAGLCFVLPCSFDTPYNFKPLNMVWFKCETFNSKCGDSDIIFHSNKRNVRDGFKGRVSLLEPDVTLRNCSIMVNDLTESDSGFYQLRLNGEKWNGSPDAFTFLVKATVSVEALTQKPTVMVPPLIEGQQASLTCIAPGFCSGSDSNITWKWTGIDEDKFYITGNMPFEKPTDVTWKQSSTLTFDTLAEFHGTNVTCSVNYRNNITTKMTVTLNVIYVKEIKVSGTLNVNEGQTLNLTCSLDSFPLSVLTWTKLHETTSTLFKIDSNNFNETWNQSGNFQLEQRYGMASLSLLNVSVEDSGQYVCTAQYLNDTLMEEVDIKVMYMRSLVKSDERTVEKGNSLNVTCWVESYPLSHITWTKSGSDTELSYEVITDIQNNKKLALLVIHNATTEDSGKYICTAEFLETSVSISTDIMVTIFPQILKSSGCKLDTKVLTCVCVSQGFPLPTITWQHLGNHTEYTVITTVSKHTINSTLNLAVTDQSSPAVDCISSNENGEMKETLITTNTSTFKEIIDPLFGSISWPEVIIAFLIGVILSAAICCLLRRLLKLKSFGNQNKALEMIATQEDPLATEEGGDISEAEEAVLDLDDEPKDVEYASIDFLVLKKKTQRNASKKQESTETEYAQIMKKTTQEKMENGKVEGEST